MPTLLPPRKGVSYSEALAEAYAVAGETEVALDTLELLNPSFRDEFGNVVSVRVVNALHSITATLEADAPLNPSSAVQFRPGFFELIRPKEDAAGALPELDLRMGNVARLLGPYMAQMSSSRTKTTAIWRPYLASDLSGPHISPVLSLTLRDVHADMQNVTARAGITDLTNRRFPSSEYTVTRFPWLLLR